ncbi:PIN domain-containing protein [Bradyrhizobium sp. 30]|uniref:PIN domain-containing protein n=1 Tax=Bradyrhizobium sp. 30 TaxID=2782669 RepID=UPI001FF81D33|nr:PIN domain-containing protein [Bradyrhizobium sp. 30]MCK1296059.1 DUF4935 domain-containing protein [Bradyrhizobium sp. 30]
MAGERPRRVFLDANVVIRAGKPPGGPLIPRVADLVDAGYIKVVTTDLTKMEIAKKHAANDFEVIGDLTKRRVRDLADEILAVKLPEISPAELHRKLIEKYHAGVESMFTSLRAETLSIDSVKPSVVFDAYARRTGLFGDDAKKDQFPDAFIFEALKAAATKSDPLTIVSDDKDFAAVIKNAEHITGLRSIAHLFAKLGLTIEAAPDVNDFVDDNRDAIVGIVHEELNQWGLQVSDVDDAEIDEADVESVSFVDFQTDGRPRQRDSRGRAHRDGCQSHLPPSRLGHRHLRQRRQGTATAPHGGRREEHRCGSEFQYDPDRRPARQADIGCRVLFR